MAKAKDAFRTISEVAEWLDTPTHVLRFWESKFSQIKPVKGAGGRRYYRPTDMDLLGGIKQLLHEDGLTIKGTQKLLREKGVKHVATLGLSMSDPAPEQPVVPPAIALVTKPVRQPEPKTKEAPVQETLPFGTPAAPEFPINLPVPPKGLPAAAPRLIGRMPRDAMALKAHAAEIAPLLARLDAVRTRMRG
ncbi:MerR family transcriptional regulator [Yoonia sp. F2084L]|uniref:MerR family transcriptional regulator n=1 Tax=Yoonia sp. F2084L TaxID=2926419 RepID=UPI001FF5782F|nr:MerR family transcriptional regulator [Yoonia sp. F2084L]MCK0094307.1 MerR family transcriptional regulator [Yoonia sp. F2084L]